MPATIPTVPVGHNVLKYENYEGNIIYNRTSHCLGPRLVKNHPDRWVRGGVVIGPIVDQALFERAQKIMDNRYISISERHEVRNADRDVALALAERRGLVLSGEQADALAHVTDGRDLGVVVGHAGTGKSWRCWAWRWRPGKRRATRFVA
jgi:hypothetical protein